MKVTIEIECDTIAELRSHLSVMRMNVLKETKRKKLDRYHDELPKDTELRDDNCYGCHVLHVTESES